MSLKTFHVIFVSVCLIFLAGLAFWAFRAHGNEADRATLLIGISSVGGFAGLAVYGVWFLKKLGRIG